MINRLLFCDQNWGILSCFFTFAQISVDRVCHHHRFGLCFSHWNEIFYWSKLRWENFIWWWHEWWVYSVYGMLNSVSVQWVIFRSCIVWTRNCPSTLITICLNCGLTTFFFGFTRANINSSSVSLHDKPNCVNVRIICNWYSWIDIKRIKKPQ